MLNKTQAIVLHSLKYGETRLIVDMFTRSHGHLSFIVNIPKSSKSKFKKQFFQPLSLLEIETDTRPKLQLQKLADVRLSSPFSSIPFDAHKLAISLFLSEFLYHALRSEQRNEPLFDYIVNSLQWFDGQPGSFASFHLVFLMRLSRFLGFYPNLDDYLPGDYFDLRESVFCAVPPVHRIRSATGCWKSPWPIIGFISLTSPSSNLSPSSRTCTANVPIYIIRCNSIIFYFFCIFNAQSF